MRVVAVLDGLDLLGGDEGQQLRDLRGEDRPDVDSGVRGKCRLLPAREKLPGCPVPDQALESDQRMTQADLRRRRRPPLLIAFLLPSPL